MKQLYMIGAIVLVLIGVLYVLARMPSGGSTEVADHNNMNDASEVADELSIENELEEPMNTDIGAMREVTLKTNKGDIVLALYTEKMPTTTANFLKLAEEDFYDGIKFHRVIEGFMLQAGDPLSKDDSQKQNWGTGGPGFTIEDEFGEGLSNVRGTIAMANTGRPNSGGSQWFINLVDNTNLDFDKQPLASKHPVFGEVVSGLDVVDAIGGAETDPSDKPLEDVVIEDIVL